MLLSGATINANLSKTYTQLLKMGIKKVNNPMTASARPRGGPKLGIKGRVTNDTIIEGNSRVATMTDVNGISSSVIRLDAIQDNNSPTKAVAGLYQSYLYKPGTSYTHVPSVGMTTSGTVAVAYIDNPELMAAFINGTAASRQVLILGTANMKMYPVWQQFTIPLTATPRNKRFDVNDTYDTVGGVQQTVEFARACQGLWGITTIGTPVSTTIAQGFLHSKLQLWGLRGSSDT